MGELLRKAFDNTITESEEATLDKMLKDWYDKAHCLDLEDFDMWTVAPANEPMICKTSLN
jgi:hypothetical protein